MTKIERQKQPGEAWNTVEADQGGGSGLHGARVTMQGGVPIVLPDGDTNIPWENVGSPTDYDTDGYLAATGDVFLTIPVGLGGLYEVIGHSHIILLTSPAGSRFQMRLTGGNGFTFDALEIIATEAEMRPLLVVDHIFLNDGDGVVMLMSVDTPDDSTVDLDAAALAVRLLGTP